MLTTTVKLEKQFHYLFVCFFISDFMKSVGISELNFIVNVFVLVWRRKKMIPFRKIILVLIFRLVWKFQKMKPETEKSFPREYVRSEVLVSLKSFLKIFRNAYVGFYDWKFIYK